MISFKILIIILLNIVIINYVKCDCGPPGKPSGANIHGYSSISKEGDIVSYECKDEFKQVYTKKRTCIRGKWKERMPKCALRLSSNHIINGYKFDYLDRNLTTGIVSVNLTFDDFKKYQNMSFKTESSKSLDLEILYSPIDRISFSQLSIQYITEINTFPETSPYYGEFPGKNLVVNSSINRYRNCIINDQSYGDNKELLYDFVCDPKSFDSYNEETYDLPKSIRFSFRSNISFMLEFMRIKIFEFQDDCGILDTPLHARCINTGRDVHYYPSNDRYKLIGEDTLKCLYEGNWDKDLPILKPIIQCETQDLGLNSSAFKRVEFLNFEFFNETEVAVIDSRIKYQCFHEKNSSHIFDLFCDENGLWIGDQNLCRNKSQTNTSLESINESKNNSNLFTIIITLFSTFVLTLIIVAVFGAVIVWHRKKLKKNQINNKFKNKNNNEYNDIINADNNNDRIDHEYADYGYGIYERISYNEFNPIEINDTEKYLEII